MHIAGLHSERSYANLEQKAVFSQKAIESRWKQTVETEEGDNIDQ